MKKNIGKALLWFMLLAVPAYAINNDLPAGAKIGGQPIASLPLSLSGIATGTANSLVGYNNSGVASDVLVGTGCTLTGGTLACSGGSGTVTTASVVSANGFSGTVANATTTPAITLSTNVNGIMKGNGTAASAATSGVDYAPATSGSVVLKGNGAGGTTAATAGTDYVAPGGALGTPASGNGTNLTGTAAGLTAGAVSTINGLITAGSNITFTGGGTSVSPYNISATSSFTPSPANFNALTGKIQIDPRDPKYGSNTCTGHYIVATSNITSGHAGTGYVVGDVVTIDSPLNGGGNPALEQIASVSTGGVPTGYTQTAAGGGYYTNTAQGTTDWTPASILTQTITGVTSNGGLVELSVASTAGFLTGAQIYVQNTGGATYVNNTEDTPFWIVTVTDSTHLTLQGSTYSSGSPWTSGGTVFREGGSGLEFDIDTIGTGNDDTAAIRAATKDVSQITSAGYVGASVAAIDGCWIANLVPYSGSTIMGNAWGPTYGYDKTIHPIWYVIGAPAFGIQASQNNVSIVGIQVDAQYDFSAFSDTVCIGSATGNSDPGGFGAKTWIHHVSVKNCFIGYGTPSGSDGNLFSDIRDSDFGTDEYGIYGALSDADITGSTFASNGAYAIYLPNSGGASFRISNIRIEYEQSIANAGSGGVGMYLQTGGAAQSLVTNVQIDRTAGPAIIVDGSQQIQFSNIEINDPASDGSLKVTGAAKCSANNDVCLTVLSNRGGPGSSGCTTSCGTSGLVSGNHVTCENIGGTTEANTFSVANIVDSDHIDISGVTFVNAYTSGGNCGAETQSAAIVLKNAVNDIYFSNMNITGTSDGNIYPFAWCIGDDRTGGYQNTDIAWYGGGCHKSTSYNNSGYTMDSGVKWYESPIPSPLTIDVDGMNYYRDRAVSFTGTASLNAAINVSATVPASASTITLSATSSYFQCIHTTAAAVTVNLPAAVANMSFLIADCDNDAATHNITIAPNGSDDINTANSSIVISANSGASGLIGYAAGKWHAQ